MKRYNIVMCALVALTTLSTGAYAAEVEKEVEVTRAYVPEVTPAVKLHLTPDMSDDSYITPDIDYTITPISIETKYDAEPYGPIKLNLEEFEVAKRYYTKLGVGAPFQSVVDIYATPIKSRQGYLMGYLNQDGRFAKIDNDYDEALNAAQNHLRGGVAAGRFFSDRTLEGSVNYNLDRWSRYATSNVVDAKPQYESLDLKGHFGDNLTDLTRLNFTVDAEAQYFWSRYGYESISFGGEAALTKELFEGVAEFGLVYNAVQGSNDYNSGALNVSLSYNYDGDFWGVKMGAEYYHDKINNHGKGYIMPNAEIFYHISRDRAIAYAKSVGDVQSCDFASLSDINPYIQDGLSSPKSEVKYDNSLGVKGSTSNGAFGYNLYANYEAKVNHIYWALYESGSQAAFVMDYSSQTALSANIDLEYMPRTNLIFGTTFSVTDYYNKKDQLYKDGDSKIELSFNAKYILNRWLFKFNAELLSPREYSVIYSDTTVGDHLVAREIPTSFDLGFSVDYSLKKSMVIFAEAKNLLNDDLYEWGGFREYGINAMVGVKMQF